MLRLRSCILILLLSVAVGFLGFFNDMVMHQTFIFGSYVPIFIYGLLLIAAIFNPLLRWLRPSLAFTGGELALMTAVLLPTCYISSRSLIHHFTLNLMMPHNYYKTEPGWQKYQLLRHLPEGVLADVPPEYRLEDIRNPDGLRAWVKKHLTASDPLERRLATVLAQKLEGESMPTVANKAARKWKAILNEILSQKDLFPVEPLGRLALPLRAREMLKIPPKNLSEQKRLNRYVCDNLLAANVVSLEDREEQAITAFARGVDLGPGEKFGLHNIPWYAWKRPLLFFWGPLIICLSFGFMGLAIVVRRQWAEHEHLSFPIIQFAGSLLPEEETGTQGPSRSRFKGLLSKKMFWIPAGIVMFIHLLNYAELWWPKYVVGIPRYFDFYSLTEYIPYLKEGGAWLLMNPRIYFTVIGFAYFVSNEVSFSLGIGPFIFAIATGFMVTHGIPFNAGGYNSLTYSGCFKAGAYFAVLCVFLYTGRVFYKALLRRACGLATEEDVRDFEVWGLRLAMLFFVGAWIILMTVGLKPLWAALWLIGFIIVFAVASRAVAETGMFLLQPHVFPSLLILAFFGPRVIGVDQFLLLLTLCGTLSIGTHVAVMCMSVHGLQLAPARPMKNYSWSAVAFIICLVVAVPVALYFQYKLGATATLDGWTKWLPTYAFKPTLEVINKFQDQGILQEAGTYSGLSWFTHIHPNWKMVSAFVIAMLLVFANDFFRLRSPSWPIHPIMFLVGAFWHGRVLAVSFLLGCLIKSMITRFGGPNSYQRLKPLMLGLIAGDMLASIIILVICTIYFIMTGEQPKSFWVFPG